MKSSKGTVTDFLKKSTLYSTSTTAALLSTVCLAQISDDLMLVDLGAVSSSALEFGKKNIYIPKFLGKPFIDLN